MNFGWQKINLYHMTAEKNTIGLLNKDAQGGFSGIDPFHSSFSLDYACAGCDFPNYEYLIGYRGVTEDVGCRISYIGDDGGVVNEGNAMGRDRATVFLKLDPEFGAINEHQALSLTFWGEATCTIYRRPKSDVSLSAIALAGATEVATLTLTTPANSKYLFQDVSNVLDYNWYYKLKISEWDVVRGAPYAQIRQYGFGTEGVATLEGQVIAQLLYNIPGISDGVSISPTREVVTYRQFELAEGTQRIQLYLDNENSISTNMEIKIYRKPKNSNPIISGADADLGAKNDEFSVSYQITDADGDSVTVMEKLNGQTLRTIENAPKNENMIIDISREQVYSQVLGTQNTIEIKVNDGKGGISYRRYTFTRTNSAPQISGNDQELGVKTEPFSVAFSATDAENDVMSTKIYLDNKLLKTYEVLPSGEEQTYELPKLEFAQLNGKDAHKLRIEVQDKNAATSIRNFTFTRSVDRVQYTFVRETDARATQVLITPTWGIAEGATGKIEVCNNAFDETPTWEDATEASTQGGHFNLTNETKTSEKWGVGVKITIEKGTATGISWLAGFGGAYK